jgi:hypothetical protein
MYSASTPADLIRDNLSIVSSCLLTRREARFTRSSYAAIGATITTTDLRLNPNIGITLTSG